MEKVIYLLWRPIDRSSSDLRRALLDELGARLLEFDPLGLQVNVLDDDVAEGAADVPQGLRRRSSDRQPEAMVSIWLRSAAPLRRQPFDDLVLAAGLPMAGYLVSESSLLVDPRKAAPGTRSRGFAQVALLRRPDGQARGHWLSRWRDHHALVAIETQSTFEYRQNLVVDALQASGPRIDGIVEESFPIEALTDRAAFYDAVGAPDRLAQNRTRMSASTRAFIDHERGLDVVPTSQYVLRRNPGT